jgi:hypothetical protein
MYFYISTALRGLFHSQLCDPSLLQQKPWFVVAEMIYTHAKNLQIPYSREDGPTHRRPYRAHSEAPLPLLDSPLVRSRRSGSPHLPQHRRKNAPSYVWAPRLRRSIRGIAFSGLSVLDLNDSRLLTCGCLRRMRILDQVMTGRSSRDWGFRRPTRLLPFLLELEHLDTT